jgi:TatA/E family protein of Tat protein translocase
MELVVILVIALLVLGPSRLPETARSLGRGMRELRESLQGIGRDDEDDDDQGGGGADIDPPPPRRDDPGGLPVDPAVVMGDVPYDDDLPDEPEPVGDDYQKEAESSTPSASS